jgi:uncharacterized protein YbbC (DUF1343 family)
MNRLLGHSATLAAIGQDKPLAEIKKLWAADLEQFRQRREAYLLYK